MRVLGSTRSASRTPTVLAVAVGLLLLGAFLQLGVASGGPTKIEFAGVFYPCSGTDPTKVWISGNVLHFRGATNHNQWVTGNPLIDGFSDNVVDGNINLMTGTGAAHPRESLEPAAFEGTWEIQVLVKIGPSGAAASGDGHGTGDLQGMAMKFTGGDEITIDPSENPCSDIPVAVSVEGEIFTRTS